MSNQEINISIRPAVAADWPVLADFNVRLAAESENKQLDPDTVARGVRALFEDSSRGRYFVACCGERVIGQLMHTREWSDWRNGDIWWLQSVYVHPEFRRRGVFRSLYRYLEELAANDPGVVGLRLYVELENGRAQQTYEAFRFKDARYAVMERMFEV